MVWLRDELLEMSQAENLASGAAWEGRSVLPAVKDEVAAASCRIA